MSTEIQNTPNSVVIKTNTSQLIKNRSNYLSSLDPFISLNGKNDEIDEIFDTAINRLQELRVFPNRVMLPTIAHAGRSFNHPAFNANIGGRQKTKRSYNKKKPFTSS